MLEIRAGRLCFDGEPITAELPSALCMRLEEHLDGMEADVLDRLVEAVDKLETHDVVQNVHGAVTSLPANNRPPLPDGYKETWLLCKYQVRKILGAED